MARCLGGPRRSVRRRFVPSFPRRKTSPSKRLDEAVATAEAPTIHILDKLCGALLFLKGVSRLTAGT